MSAPPDPGAELAPELLPEFTAEFAPHQAGVDVDLVERLVDEFVRAGGQPGLAYGVVRHGRVLHAGGRGTLRIGGPAPDQWSVFRIASMTKSFTAAAVLLLRDQGRLRLDDELAQHLPELAGLRPPTDDAPALTVRSLLSMTAGLPTDDPWGDRQQDLPEDAFTQLLHEGLSFAWTPGTAYEYSNLGYALLGRLVTAAAGMPYRELVTSRLLEPLRMTSTGFTAEQFPTDRLAVGYRPSAGGWQPVPFAGYGAFAPMGGLFSSVDDLARWIGGFTDAYPPRDGDGSGGHPLCRASRREQQQPHRTLPPVVTWRSLAEPPVIRGLGYGFGLLVELDPRIGELVSHSGGYPGFGSHMRWHPASGLGVVVLGNATYAPAGRLGTQLLDALLLPDSRASRPGAAPAPSGGGSMVAATQAAADDVNRLIRGWDDDLAGRLLADNVDRDEPLVHRQAQLEQINRTVGPLEPDPDGAVTSFSPAHRAWWLRGPGGRVRVEIRLTPQRPPRVQTLTVTAVPHPPRRLRLLAERVAAAMAQDGPQRWFGELSLATSAEPDRVVGELLVGRAWAGPSTVAEVLAGDGVQEAIFRLAGRRAQLRLSLTVPPEGRLITGFSLVPLHNP